MEAIRTSSIVLFEQSSHTPRPISGYMVMSGVSLGFFQDSEKISNLFETYTRHINLPPLPSRDRIHPTLASFLLPFREVQSRKIQEEIGSLQEMAKNYGKIALDTLTHVYIAAMERIGLGVSVTAMTSQDGSRERTEEVCRLFNIAQTNGAIEEIRANYVRAVADLEAPMNAIRDRLYYLQGEWGKLCELGI